ncbi:MAG: PilZ domain-containing protein [Planctomycetes bacterium]|nr:PilZ domain-containing protein [Planctomycetota bacterium]
MAKKPRRSVRNLVDIPVEIRGEKLVFGSGRDLSEAGLRVRLESRVRMGERVGVTFRLPGFANVDLNFSAEVRWVKAHPSGGVWEAGLEFDHTPETSKRIHLLLWELQAGNLKEIERRHRTRRAPPQGKQGGI